MSWAAKALGESDITKEEHDKLYEVAFRCAAKGMWRGDICDQWRELGFGPGKIKDWYP